MFYRASGSKRPQIAGFWNLIPHFGGTLDVEGKVVVITNWTRCRDRSKRSSSGHCVGAGP